MPGPFPRDYDALANRITEGVSPSLSLHERMNAVTAILWEGLRDQGVDWLGFYEIDPSGEDMLLVCREPKPACSPITLHGVCGKAYQSRAVQVVEDVHALGEAHIVCDPANLSEIVVPLIEPDGSCRAVLDLDSRTAGAFSATDGEGLQRCLVVAGLTRDSSPSGE